MDLKTIGKLLGIGLALVILALAIGSSGQVGLGQAQEAPCTVTLAPGQSIQKAIDSVPDGAVICLEPGEWKENLVIKKGLTLKGAGRDRSIIKGKYEGKPKPVIRIVSHHGIEVTIEGLTFAEAMSRVTQREAGIQIGGKAIMIIWDSEISRNEIGIEMRDSSQATISGSQIAGNGWGILMRGSSRATISGSTISVNRDVGIVIWDSPRAEISDSQIPGNDWGIVIGDSSQAEISDSTVSENGGGISMWKSSQVTISDSEISGNGEEGIWMWESSQATISDSEISGNGDGIWMRDSSQATISDSEISGNGDGIVMWDSSQAEILGSRFLNNRYCGIEVETEEASVRGGPNEMKGNGADLCGFAPVSLRQPLVPQTERKELSVPGDYSSLQEAIDAIAPGGTITLAPGTYEEGLTIWKPLTIRGAGKEETVLKPLPNPTRGLIVSIIAGAKGVALEGLTITGRAGDGLLIYGEASLKGLQISGNGDGIRMWDSSRATISDSEISGNGVDGIEMKSSQAEIFSSTISGNDNGIFEMLGSQITISDSEISGNDRYGIWMWGSSQAEISDSQISGNGDDGIWMYNSSQATISSSTISGNRKNGIRIEDSSQATIRGNKIFENKGYGVVLSQRPCFDTDDKFKGKVEGSGNEIHDNGKGDVCPEELEFLKTEEGGCYGAKC